MGPRSDGLVLLGAHVDLAPVLSAEDAWMNPKRHMAMANSASILDNISMRHLISLESSLM